MELAALDIDQDEARERLAEYRALIYEERTAEDDAIAAGFRAAARGLVAAAESALTLGTQWRQCGGQLLSDVGRALTGEG